MLTNSKSQIKIILISKKSQVSLNPVTKFTALNNYIPVPTINNLETVHSIVINMSEFDAILFRIITISGLSLKVVFNMWLK